MNAESIKNQIIQTAGSFGFSYEEEKSVNEGTGRVDLVLALGELIVACEISATTDAQQEVRNLQKCLRAGYRRIVHVCDHPKRRERIEALVSGQVPSADLSRIRYLSTRQFLGHLGELATTTIGKSEAAKGDKAAVVSSGPTSPEDDEAEIKRMLAEIHERRARNNPPT